MITTTFELEKIRSEFEAKFTLTTNFDRDVFGRYINPVLRSAWTWFCEGMNYNKSQ